ncbi:unnamed protein product [Calypogeia fissa]
MPPLGATCPRPCFSCNSSFFVSAQPAASSSGYGLASTFNGGEWQWGRLRLSKRAFLRESSMLSWRKGRVQNQRVTRSHDARDAAEMFFEGEDKDMWRVSAYGDQLPNQAETVTGATTIQAEFKSLPDLDYLQELLAIQQSGPRAIGFFGTRNMGFMHQQLIEILSYAMVITKNHIYTSGASGTNAAVIRGALRAEMPELLTVILPQSLKKQPPESQELLSKVKNVIEMPHNDHLPLLEASRLCNMDILSHVQQVICFAFHDSNLLMETCREAKNLRKIVTLFYLD